MSDLKGRSKGRMEHLPWEGAAAVSWQLSWEAPGEEK